MQDAARDDEVVALRERDLAELRLEHAARLADVDDLVALRVAVEEVVLAIGLHEQHRDVGVEEQRHAIERQAAARRELVRAEVAVPELPLGIALPLQVAQRAAPLAPCVG